MSGRRIGLLLDTTAVLAYAHWSVHAQETVLMVMEDGLDAAVPLLCLVEAAERDPKVDLDELLHHEHVVILPERPEWRRLLTQWAAHFGSVGFAAALLEQHRYGCYVLTAEADAYAVLGKVPAWVIALG